MADCNEKPLSTWEVMGSLLASAFGVQSEKARERDFHRGKIHQFVIAAIVFTLVFILSIYGIVQLVLSYAAA